MEPNEKIYDHFFWKDVIQEDGDGGKVVICRKKAEDTKEFKYVLKIRTKASIEPLQDLNEFRRMLVKMLNIPSHNGVMPYLEVLEDDTHFYCVMEKAAGGSLLSYLVTKHSDGCVPEAEMKELMREILHAVGHIHNQGMIHRDIKPDNIVVRKIEDPSSSSSSKVDRVTIIDFDHAEMNYSPCTPSPRSPNIWGTTGYNAPETYLGHFSPASDLFSVGVTLYLLMTGKMPYDRKALKQIDLDSPQVSESLKNEGRPKWVSHDECTKVRDKMCAMKVDWSCDPWPQNEPCRSFCQSLLHCQPQRRPRSVAEALQHKWLVQTPKPFCSPSLAQSLEAAANPGAAESPCRDKPLLPPSPSKNIKHIMEVMRTADTDLVSPSEPPQNAEPLLSVANSSTEIKRRLRWSKTEVQEEVPEEIEVEQDCHKTDKVLSSRGVMNHDLSYLISPKRPVHRRVLSEHRQLSARRFFAAGGCELSKGFVEYTCGEPDAADATTFTSRSPGLKEIKRQCSLSKASQLQTSLELGESKKQDSPGKASPAQASPGFEKLKRQCSPDRSSPIGHCGVLPTPDRSAKGARSSSSRSSSNKFVHAAQQLMCNFNANLSHPR